MSHLALPATPAMPAASPTGKGVALGLSAALIWGAYLALARAGVSSGLTAEDVAFLRYTTAGAILLPWFLRNNPRTAAGVGWLRALVLALLVGPPFILIGVGGYTYAPLAHGAAIQPAALTLGATALAVVFAGERIGRARAFGLAAMIAGIALVAGKFAGGGALTWKGDLMFAVAGLMWATFGLLARRWSLSPLQSTAAVSVVSATIYAPIFFLGEGFSRLLAAEPGMLAAQIVVQGALSGVVAVLAYTRAVQLLGPGRAALFPALVPAVAVAIGIPVADEIPAPLQVVGIALATLGLIASIRR